MGFARPRLTLGKDARIEPSKRMVNQLDPHKVKHFVLAGILSERSIKAKGNWLLLGSSAVFGVAFERGGEHQLALIHNVNQVRCPACLFARVEWSTSNDNLEIATLRFRHDGWRSPRRRRIEMVVVVRMTRWYLAAGAGVVVRVEPVELSTWASDDWMIRDELPGCRVRATNKVAVAPHLFHASHPPGHKINISASPARLVTRAMQPGTTNGTLR